MSDLFGPCSIRLDLRLVTCNVISQITDEISATTLEELPAGFLVQLQMQTSRLSSYCNPCSTSYLEQSITFSPINRRIGHKSLPNISRQLATNKWPLLAPVGPVQISAIPGNDNHRAPPLLSSSTSAFSQSFISKLLLLLTLLPLCLAALAFVLQWRGGFVSHPAFSASGNSPRGSHHEVFPCMETLSLLSPKAKSSSSSDWTSLGRSLSPSFPYYGDWKFDFHANLKPKICITTSTSAGLDQILPWMFYHKVIGVANFFLFVAGKAASSNVSRVLESIPTIIQGLRGSGTFSSVIASASTTLSKDKFLASIESINSSRVIASQSLPSQKTGRSGEDQTSARKPLDMEAEAIHEAAVPALSPPGVETDH